ncbi:site-specific DNA recombinase [Neobacillus niacini]|uniref:recombinase family protein n=1 Tax=Neobacillus driksii TaxID=3035913 RepID=UPI0027849323|nr:recombinase family protein [Neobacillus niacini]MDQ0975861.1 site-specific DNA recombinase [Neobacillus niacini]
MKVAIYLRRSRDEEKLGIDEVLKVHQHTLVNLCEQQGHSYDIYREVASSSSIENRPEMVRLLKRIKEGYYQAVVVMDIDRLSRNEFDSSDIKRILHDTGTLIITPYRVYDLTQDDDSLLVGVTSLIASQEYKMIHKRMKRGKQYAQQQGLWTDGIPPLGYTKGKDKKLSPNDRADDIRYIFNSIIEGVTIPDLIRNLDRLQIKTRTGSKWHYNAILRIVNNEVYKGNIHGIEGTHEAIVSVDTWKKANTIVNEYSFKAPRSKNKIYPTTGLIYCGNCGKVQGCNYHPHIDKLYIKVCRCGNRTFYYNDVLKLIKQEVLSQKETILTAISSLDTESEVDNTRHRIELITKAMKKAEKALDKIQIQFEEDDITLPQYRERKAMRNEELEILRAELDQLKKEDPSDKRKTLEDYIRIIDELSDEWELLESNGLSNEEVNRKLHSLISGIVWRYPKNGEPILRVIYK